MQDMYETATAVDEGVDAATEAWNSQYYWGHLAPSLTSGQCDLLGGSCSECRWSERKKGLRMEGYRCKDRKVYQYGKRCTDEQKAENGNLCMTGDDSLCHIS